jgi:hypothetical protein
MILSTIPGTVVLARSETRAVFRFTSSLHADLAIRGLANSFLTLASVASSNPFLALFFIVLP